MSQRLSPELLDFALNQFGFQGQHTDDLKSPQAPDALFEPMDGYEQVEGDFNHLTVPSFSDWLMKQFKGS